MADTNEKKNELKKSNPVVYGKGAHFLLNVLSFIWKLVFRVKYVRTPAVKEIKQPMLVLATHTSVLDLFYASGVMRPRKMTYVVAESMLSSRLFCKVITAYGAITKKQFFSDFVCIKQIKRYIDAGISVVVFPEGRVSVDGKTGYISPAIAKLVKWLKVPVASLKICGGVPTRPKWAKKVRMGGVTVNLDALLSSDDVARLSADEINNIVLQRLQYNEYKSTIENGKKYLGGSSTDGLERALYRCPVCQSEFKMLSKGNKLVCGVCGNGIAMKSDYSFSPYHDADVTSEISDAKSGDVAFKSVDEWVQYERDEIEKSILENDFCITDLAKLYKFDRERFAYDEVGDGEITLDREHLTFTDSDGNRLVDVATADIPSMTIKVGHAVDVADGSGAYRMVLKSRESAVKYSLAVDVLFAIRERESA